MRTVTLARTTMIASRNGDTRYELQVWRLPLRNYLAGLAVQWVDRMLHRVPGKPIDRLMWGSKFGQGADAIRTPLCERFSFWEYRLGYERGAKKLGAFDVDASWWNQPNEEAYE